MNKSITGLLKGRRSRCHMATGLATLLVFALPAVAGEKQEVFCTGEGLAFDPGQTTVTPSGRVHLRGMGSEAKMESANPLFTGRLTWVGNFNGDATLTGVGSGTGVFEIGTWDSSTAPPVFTPSPAGGVYVTKWEGRGNPLGPYEIKIIGHGIAGEVEGMQFNVTGVGSLFLTYYNGQLLDPHHKP